MQAKINHSDMFDDESDAGTGEANQAYGARFDEQYDRQSLDADPYEDQIDIDAYDDEPFDAPANDNVSDRFERLQSTVSQIKSRFGQSLRAAWSRLVPSVSEAGGDWDDDQNTEYDGEDDYMREPDSAIDPCDDINPDVPAWTESPSHPDIYDKKDTYLDDYVIDELVDDETDDLVIDATDDHYVNLRASQELTEPAPATAPSSHPNTTETAAPADKESPASDNIAPPRPKRITGALTHPQPDRLLSARKRRPMVINSHISRLPDVARAPSPLIFSSIYNELSWNRSRGILTISEPIMEEADENDPLAPRRSRSVVLTIRTLDERITPILLGVVNAIDSSSGVCPDCPDDASEPTPWTEELPYVCQSGQNTFCWYRQNMQLKIFCQKRVDDRGLLRSGKCVVLYARYLPLESKPIFQEIVAIRSLNDPFKSGL